MNEKQTIGLKYFDELNQKIPRDEIKKHETFLTKILKEVNVNATLTIAGSYRRGKNESSDIDVLLKMDKKDDYKRYIKQLRNIGYLIEDLAMGTKKYNGISKLGSKGIPRRIDIMYTTQYEYPFAILYFTGSGEFNQRMRKEINQEGYSINEYNLKTIPPNKHQRGKIVNHTFNCEKDIFDYFNLEYIDPKERV